MLYKFIWKAQADFGIELNEKIMNKRKHGFWFTFVSMRFLELNKNHRHGKTNTNTVLWSRGSIAPIFHPTCQTTQDHVSERAIRQKQI